MRQSNLYGLLRLEKQPRNDFVGSISGIGPQGESVVTILLFIASFSILLLSVVYLNNRVIANRYQSLDEIKTAELEKLRRTEQTLQQELTGLKSKLRYAIQDPVTELQGWQLFHDMVNKTLSESIRYHLIMGIMYVDINEFHVVNDALGDEVGDALLREVAARLQMCIRQIDGISRFAKDTFVVLLNQLAKPEAAAVIAQRMLQAIEQPIQINEHTLYITASIGIAIYPDDGQDAAVLIRNANNALHMAKAKGNQVYQFYQEKIFINSQRELALSGGVRRHSISDELIVSYHAIKNMRTDTVFCITASLQWQHPEFGLVSQQELYSHADKQSKINPISEWLLKSACQTFLKWRQTGVEAEVLGISLSIKQLENSQFIYRMSQILQELAFNPEWLMVIIKDNKIQLSFDVLEKAFNMLTYLKVKLAIDHFGACPFSLRDLKHFPVNYLMLDPSLLKCESNQMKKTASLIKAVNALAHSLSAELIVQGVETSEEIAMLQEVGCYLLEGPAIHSTVT